MDTGKEEENSMASTLAPLVRLLESHYHLFSEKSGTKAGQCCSSNQEAIALLMIPFLRYASLLFHCISTSPSSKPVSSSNAASSSNHSSIVNAMNQCLSFLSLPSIDEMIKHHLNEFHLFVNFMKAERRYSSQWWINAGTLLDGFQSVALCQLPKDYNDIYSLSVSGICTNCKKGPRSPAICLTCSRLVCPDASCCRRLRAGGEISYHTAECMRDQGMYLILQECSLLLSSHGIGIEYGSCYADEHGELDVGLRRGRALHLDDERLNSLIEGIAHQNFHSVVSRFLHNQAYGSAPNRNRL